MAAVINLLFFLLGFVVGLLFIMVIALAAVGNRNERGYFLDDNEEENKNEPGL